jgi:hypothetical protein
MFAMKKILTVFSAVVLILTFSFLDVSAERHPVSQNTIFLDASRNAPDCYSLDIVFLIDQSLSMSRLSDPNDPLGQRFNAPRYALDWLANNRLSRLGICPDAVHRIGVISFGSEVIADLPLTRIEPDTQLEWNDILPGLEDQIKERNMGGTNPSKAFTSAKEMLDNAEHLGPLPRKRAIVLLTDGQPCITEECNDATGDFYESYMKNLVKQVSDDFPFSIAVEERDDAVHEAEQQYGGLDKIPEVERNRILVDYPVSDDELYNSIYVWVIAMNDAYPYLDSVGDNFETLAVSHNGSLIDLEQNLLEIPKVFNQIMSNLVDIKPTLLGCGNLAVDPYLSGVVLDIYKAANGLEVEIDYNDKHLKNGSGDLDYFGLAQYSQYGAVEHYRFTNPPAGLWKIVCSDPNGAEVSYMPFNAQIQMVEPSGILPQYDLNNAIYDPVHKFYLKYKIVDQTDAEPLNLDSAYPLDMKATISNPGGGQTILPFKFEGEGIWASAEPLPVNTKGVYQIDLIGNAPCVVDPDKPEHCQSPTIEVIHSTIGQYEVGEISLFQINVVEPEDGEIVPLHGKLLPDWLTIQQVVVKVQLVDLDGQPVNISKVLLVNPEQALTAVLNIGEEEFTAIMVPDPTDETRFTAHFDAPAVPGTHIIKITMGDVYNFEDYRPQQNPVKVTFERKDPLLQNPTFYRVLLALIVLVFTGLALYFIWLRTFPLLGALTFVKRDETGEKNAVVSLGRRRRKVVLKRKAIPADLKSDFKAIEAINQPAQGKGQNARTKIKVALNGGSLFNLPDGQSVTKNGWQVTYTWGQPSKQKDRFGIWAIVAIVVAITIIVGILVG